MDNQNSNNINNVNNNINTNPNINPMNQQTTTLPTSNVNNNVAVAPATDANQNKSNEMKKDGCFKYLVAFIFLIGIILFVLFLPNITEFIESKKGNSTDTSDQKVQNGTLICTMTKANDNTSYDYEMKMTFNSEKLGSTKFTTTIESYDTKALTDKKQSCDKASEIAKTIEGLNMECRLNDTVLTTIENYELKTLNTSSLTPYTEASGTYPEFEYEKNIYDIKLSLEKEGYDCKVSSSVTKE